MVDTRYLCVDEIGQVVCFGQGGEDEVRRHGAVAERRVELAGEVNPVIKTADCVDYEDRTVDFLVQQGVGAEMG